MQRLPTKRGTPVKKDQNQEREANGGSKKKEERSSSPGLGESMKSELRAGRTALRRGTGTRNNFRGGDRLGEGRGWKKRTSSNQKM